MAAPSSLLLSRADSGSSSTALLNRAEDEQRPVRGLLPKERRFLSRRLALLPDLPTPTEPEARSRAVPEHTTTMVEHTQGAVSLDRRFLPLALADRARNV